MTEQRARELLRRIKRTSEMSAGLMRDKKRTGGWAGSEGTAQQFDRLAKYAAEAATALAESAKSPSDSVREALAIEQVAQFLHDEGGFDDAWSNHTWPEHADDTGQRDGGFVKIVPSDVQAKFRDVARRLLTMPIAALSTPFAESAKSPSDSVRRLVITARELLDESDDGSDAARALDRALEDFAGAVPFADESNDIRAPRKAAPPPAIAEAAFAALDGSAVTRLLTKFAQAADFSNARDCQIYGALLAYSDARAALQSSEADNG